MADIKYTHIFKSDKGTEWTINLHDLDYSGASTEVRAEMPGFKLNYNSESDNLDEPIKASDLTFSMFVEDSTMETYLSSLLNKQEKKVYITIQKSGAYYWGGVVLTDLIKLQSSAYPYTCEFKATDYIGTLKDLTFNSANFTQLTAGSYAPMTKYFAEIFSKPFPGTGFFYLNSGELFSTASPLYETQMSTSVDVFAKTKSNTAAFTDQDNKYTLTYYQVLEQILVAFNCRMWYNDGIYKIIDNRFFDYYTSWKEFYYDKDGAELSNSSYDNHVDCSTSPDTSRIFLADPINEYDMGLKLARIRFTADADVRSDVDLNPSTTFATNYSTLFNTYRDGILGCDFYTGQSFSRLLGGTGQKLKFRFEIKNSGLNTNKLKYIYIYMTITDGTSVKVLSNRKIYLDGINPTTKKPEPYTWETFDGDQCLIIPYSATNVGSFITIETPNIPLGVSNWIINSFYIGVGGDYDVYRNGSFIAGIKILNISTLNLEVGMVCQDLGLGRLPVSPQTKISYIYPFRTAADIDQFPTGSSSSASSQTTKIGFLIPANDIVSGDESYITIALEYIYYLADGVDYDNEGVFFKTENTLQMSEKYYLPDVYIGDTIQTENKSSLKVVNSGGSDVFSLAWNIKPALATQTARPLLQKLTENIMAHRYKALKKYQGALFTTSYFPTMVLRYKSQTLVYNGGSFDAAIDEWSGTWHVWQNSLANQSHGATNTGTKASNVDITKDIYPHIDLPNLDNNLKGLWTSNGDVTAQLNVANQLIQAVQKETQDYIGNDPQFTTELSVTTPTLTFTKFNDIILTPSNGKFWKIDGTGTAILQFEAGGPVTPYISSIGTLNAQSPKVAQGVQVVSGVLYMQTVDASFPGIVTSAQKGTWDAKQDPITFGDLTEATSSVLLLTNNTGVVKGSGTTIQIKQASASQGGYISATDFSSFANKQATISIATIDSVSPKVANGAQLSGAAIVLQTADSSFPGVVSIGTQTFAGAKTFSTNPTFSAITAGQMLFSGTGGLVSANTSLTWDNTNKYLLGASNLRAGRDANSYIEFTNNASKLYAAGDITLFSTNGGGTANVNIQNNGSSGGEVIKVKLLTGSGAGTERGSITADTSNLVKFFASTTEVFRISTTVITIADGKNVAVGTTTGTTFGTTTSQKLSFWNKTPIVQPTTSITGATFASPGAGTNIKTDDTFGGYTIGQIAAALINMGILA